MQPFSNSQMSRRSALRRWACIGAFWGACAQEGAATAAADDAAAARCGTPDFVTSTPSSNTAANTQAAYTLFPGRWPATHTVLLYKFVNFTPDLDPDAVRAAFRHAMDRWSAVVPVEFQEVAAEDKAEISIGWYDDDHGDGYKFGKALAHAFPPVCEGDKCTSRSGNFHLSHNCKWVVGFGDGARKCDLRHVALHELGHVLGLDHSADSQAVMRASYNHRLELGEDDVEGAQSLYGSPENPLDGGIASAAGGLGAASAPASGGCQVHGAKRFAVNTLWMWIPIGFGTLWSARRGRRRGVVHASAPAA